MTLLNNTWTLLLLCFLAGLGLSAGQDIHQMQYHLEKLTSVRHPFGADPNAREAARSYIKEQFQQYGLEVAVHTFSTTVWHQGQQRTVAGENVIGVSEGAGGGPLLLVGADYDTALNRHPLEDNGAGVGAMLEVARNYMAATGPDGVFTRNSTVIFVAFDLNTQEYDGSTGEPGAYHFVHQWLWPHLNQSLLKFAGAIILDSISKINMDQNSQYLPQDFGKAFPSAYKRISEDGNKGDFLALVTRGTSQSKRLKDTFTGNYLKHRKAGLIRLQELVVHTNSPVSIPTLEMINHQAHYHFWTFQPSDQLTALPALLLTDTDFYRKSSEECPLPCSAEAFLTRQRKQSLALTCSGVLYTLLDMQAERRRPGETGEVTSGASVGVTLAMTWLLAAVAAILH
ncbi:uncharacterized protein LOC126993904 [Eriocheir sinensis]|uniref:uncharacterized protein LOC126993904 n=1 Tax=Eriocheir sinensis TaxID=95602 RepID=UPI0021C958FE|nr:uncharacterized protein LOC126993904 [Eriocheir sinensis]